MHDWGLTGGEHVVEARSVDDVEVAVLLVLVDDLALAAEVGDVVEGGEPVVIGSAGADLQLLEQGADASGVAPVTVPLVSTSVRHRAIRFSTFNDSAWRPALAAAGIELRRSNGCHALRHHFASVLLDGGESIKAVSEYLGHSDAGFTLRTYTHLMRSSSERTRRAIDQAWAAVP